MSEELNLQYMTCLMTIFPAFSLHFTHTLDLSYLGFSVCGNESTSHHGEKKRKKSDPLVINTDSPCAPWISAAVLQDMICDKKDSGVRNGGAQVDDPARKTGESKSARAGVTRLRRQITDHARSDEINKLC